jgi:hypothetical protein
MNKVLNLVHPEKSEIQYTLTTFPDGEPHIVLDDFNAKWDVTIKCRIRNPNELFILCEVLDILNRNGVYSKVEIYYLMSMRMDRVMDITRPFSLKMVCDVLNMFDAEYHVYQAHSDKTFKLLNNSFKNTIPLRTIVTIIKSQTNGTIVVYPDGSAEFWLSDGTIIKSRDKMTLEDIGACYGVTREAIRQQITRILRRLKTSEYGKVLEELWEELDSEEN